MPPSTGAGGAAGAARDGPHRRDGPPAVRAVHKLRDALPGRPLGRRGAHAGPRAAISSSIWWPGIATSGSRLSSASRTSLNIEWREAQFYFTSRLAGEPAAGVPDIHYTAGTPAPSWAASPSASNPATPLRAATAPQRRCCAQRHWMRTSSLQDSPIRRSPRQDLARSASDGPDARATQSGVGGGGAVPPRPV